MKVKQLIAELEKLKPDLELLCYCEDDEVLADGHLFRILHIKGVTRFEAERARDENRAPTLKIGHSRDSETLGAINVTAIF